MGQNFDALVAAAKQHYLHLTGSEWSAETKNAYDSSLVATAVLNVLKERFICNLGMENVFELNSQ